MRNRRSRRERGEEEGGGGRADDLHTLVDLFFCRSFDSIQWRVAMKSSGVLE